MMNCWIVNLQKEVIMTKKFFCDYCGKEIDTRVFATQSESGFSFLEIDEEADFCSESCKQAFAEDE